jgi:DNA-binding NarL/FixJ family response regulator
VGAATTGPELVALAEEAKPVLVLSNADLAEGGLERVLERVVASGARVLAVLSSPSPERMAALLERGASGLLLLDSSAADVVEALDAVGRGEIALHPTAASTVVEQWRRLRAKGAWARMSGPGQLTPRERDVLEAMADGLATKAIAARLGMANKTVENHKIRIFDKLGARTHAHAVSLAIGHGLLSAFGD